MKLVIGIGGRMQHGKDAVAARLRERHDFTVVPFAQALKAEVLERFPRTLQAIHELNHPYGGLADSVESQIRRDVYDLKPPGIRELLQEYGTEVRRADDSAYWVRRWAETASAYERVAVPDVRFPNEAGAVAYAGGTLWRVVRPCKDSGGTCVCDFHGRPLRACAIEDTNRHSSETAVDGLPWHETIVNDGTLEQLWAKVDALMRTIR